MPVLKRTPAGAIYARTDSDRLTIYFRGRRIHSGLRNTRVGIQMAEDLLSKMWRDEEGVGKPARPRRMMISAAWEEFAADWFPGKEPKTVTYYQTAANQCLTMGAALTSVELEQQMKRVKANRNLTAASQAIYIRALRTFGRWAVDRGYLASAPRVKVKVPEKPVETFSTVELDRIIRAAHARDPEFGALVELLAATGMRIHEALELKWSDLRGGAIELMSKDGKRRERISITPRVKAALAPLDKSRPDVFRWRRSTASRLHRTWVEILASAAVEHRGRGFHTLRKTRWTQVIASGVNHVVAANLMRCSIKIAMKHYIQLDLRDIDRAARRADAFPVSSLSKSARPKIVKNAV